MACNLGKRIHQGIAQLHYKIGAKATKMRTLEKAVDSVSRACKLRFAVLQTISSKPLSTPAILSRMVICRVRELLHHTFGRQA